jgi:hypothetical protein
MDNFNALVVKLQLHFFMKFLHIAYFAAIFFALLRNVFGQGFVNLDFEDANLSGYSAGSVPAADAIPGWTAYIGGTPLTNINYNIRTSGGIEVSVIGANSGSIIQGNYYVYLQGTGGVVANEVASIGQAGTIPVTAQSLIFRGDIYNFEVVSFNGQELPLSEIGSGSNYTIYGADISAFAGHTGQLLFTSRAYPAAKGDAIDNIQFSSSPIPEQSELSLFGICILLLFCFSVVSLNGLTSRRSQCLLALAVPLSRFPPRVRHGSAFCVRHRQHANSCSTSCSYS